MGFNKVYQSLLSVFPQVDSRLLKAVAIENSKDINKAAEIVCLEILPHVSRVSVPPSLVSPRRMPSSSTLLDRRRIQLPQIEDEDERNQIMFRQIPLAVHDSAYPKQISGSSEGFMDVGFLDAGLGETSVASAQSVYDYRNRVLSTNTEGEELILLGTSQRKGNEKYQIMTSTVEAHKDSESTDKSLAGGAITESEGLDLSGKSQNINIIAGSESTINLTPVTPGISNLNGCAGDSVSLVDDLKDFDGPNPLDVVQGLISDTPNSGINSECASKICQADSGDQECERSADRESGRKSFSEMDEVEDESALNPAVGRSSQISRIDLLEEIIEDAKNNKRTLFQALQSVMSLMREVELQEEAAERAKEEAAKGGLDTLSKVEELKALLTHAKEANDMHAGEVYGEKAILATEVRELQGRLLSLSEERDRSLAILNEMRQTLEARQAAAEEVRKAAEEEKLEREESAKSALAEQEAIMEKVVQESNRLQQEAEENSKLQEFLIDRGRVVDLLQGEISVICQDVRLLKEKFDDRVPLSESISSSQTTCILASSGSSIRSYTSYLAPEDEVVKMTDRRSSTTSLELQSFEEDRSSPARAELVDDGWDLIGNDAELHAAAM